MSESGNSSSGQVQACASCKYQRRKCSRDCPLAPYFPANRPEDFKNAHKLFGVSNITKILKSIDPDRRPAASKSIIIEAKFRKEDPVHGSAGVIHKLMKTIAATSKEVSAVNRQLMYFRQIQEQQQDQQFQRLLDSRASCSTSSLQMIQHPYGSYYYQPPPPINLSNELHNLGGMKSFNAGCTCIPPLQEYESFFSSVDIKPINRLIANTFHQNIGAMDTKEAEESSAESTVTDKPSTAGNSDKGLQTDVEPTLPSKVTSKKGKECVE